MLTDQNNRYYNMRTTKSRNFYKSHVKPSRSQLRRRQLPKLFEASCHTKRKLSESLRNLNKFVNNLDGIDHKQMNELISPASCGNIRNTETINEHYLSRAENASYESPPTSLSDNELFSSDKSLDLDWSQSKDPDLANVFVKQFNGSTKLNLKPIYDRDLGKEYEKHSSDEKQDLGTISKPRKLIFKNVRKNNTNSIYFMYKAISLNHAYNIFTQYNASQNKNSVETPLNDAINETVRKINYGKNHEIKSQDQKCSNYKCNDTTPKIERDVKYHKRIRSLNKNVLMQKHVQILNQELEGPLEEPQTVLNTIDEGDKMLSTANDKLNENPVNDCSVVPLVRSKEKRSHHCNRHNVEFKGQFIDYDLKGNYAATNIKESFNLHKRNKRNNICKRYTNKFNKIKKQKFKFLKKRSVLKSPGWSRLNENLIELNALCKHKRTINRLHVTQHCSNNKTKGNITTVLNAESPKHCLEMLASKNNKGELCSPVFTSNEINLKLAIAKNLKQSTRGRNGNLLREVKSNNNELIEINFVKSKEKTVFHDTCNNVVVSSSGSGDFNNSEYIYKDVVLNIIKGPHNISRSISVISSSQKSYRKLAIEHSINKFNSNLQGLQCHKTMEPQDDSLSPTIISTSQPNQFITSNLENGNSVDLFASLAHAPTPSVVSNSQNSIKIHYQFIGKENYQDNLSPSIISNSQSSFHRNCWFNSAN